MLTPTTFDGTDITASPYLRASFVRGDGAAIGPMWEPVQASVAGAFGEVVRAQPRGKYFPLFIQLDGTTQAKFESFQELFDPEKTKDGTLVYLKATDGTPATRRMAVQILQAIPDEQAHAVGVAWRVSLYAPVPMWEEDSEDSDTQTDKAASPVEWTLTPNGSARCYPTFEITPTVSKDHDTYWKRRRHIIIANTVKRTLTSTNGLGYPIDVFANALDGATIIAASQMQADGDDVRLFVDGQLVASHVGSDRWFQDLNSATSQMWANLSYSPGKIATLDGAMTDESPADGESIDVDNVEGLAGWPESGFIVVDDECIYYASRTLTSFDNITRAVRGTTAAAHDDASDIYWVEHEVYFEYDYTAATAGPEPDDTKPVISLASTNAAHAYPGPFMAPTTLRTGQFLDDYREVNELSPYMSREDTGTALKFLDSPSAAGTPRSVGAVLYTPAGVDTAANSLEQDVTVPANMLARVYGTDEEGNESLIEEWDSDTDGADEQLTPSDELVRLRYEAVVRTVTAAEGAGSISDYEIITGTDQLAQGFTLDQECMLYGVSVRLKKVGNPSGNVLVHIMKGGTAGDPDSGGYCIWNETLVAAASIGVAYDTYTYFFTSPVSFAAGSDYYLILERSDSDDDIYWEVRPMSYARGSFWDETASAWTEYPGANAWFRLYGDGSVCQDEVPTDTDEYVEWDDFELTFDSPPYVKVSAAEEIYAYAGRLENTTTGQYVDVWGSSELNETLTINCATKSVTGGELGLACPALIDPSDDKDWMHLNAGANSMKWTEATIGTLTIVSKWRGRWS